MRKRARCRWLWACAVFFIGCSSESVNSGGGGSGGSGSGGAAGSDGGGGEPAICTQMCDAIDTAKCPAESRLKCLSVCAVARTDCPSLSDDFATCLIEHQAEITCDSNGRPVYSACTTELAKVIPCTVCVPDSEDGTEEACLKEHCCAEMKAAYSLAEALPYAQCVEACTGDLCKNDCAASFPEAGKAFSNVDSCRTQHCAGG